MIENLDKILFDFKNSNNIDEKIDIIRKIEDTHTTSSSEYENIEDFNPIILNIRNEYANLLYSVELESSAKISSWDALHSFYKWDVYKARCMFELSCANLLTNSLIKNALFVGAGAVPISSIIASQMPQLNVTALEKDIKAHKLAKNLCKSLNIDINLININLFEFINYENFDIIIVSGTVGSTDYQKNKIIQYITSKMKLNSLLCLRAPVREEHLLMAPIKTELENFAKTIFYLENENDYISRVFYKKIK